MSYTEQSLLVTTVSDDHTIVLPDSIPSGAKIGIIHLSDVPQRILTRKERFKAALAEIEKAIQWTRTQPI